MNSVFTGTLQATSVVTKNIDESLRFYCSGLGYNVIEEGELSIIQKEFFGAQLDRYLLLGHDRESVIRLLETKDKTAQPHRISSRPWDVGLSVIEAGATDIDSVYKVLLSNRYGVICPPQNFHFNGPEPLGYVAVKAIGLYGPNGEQLFITETKKREGGSPLWEIRKDINVYPPGNVVISLQDRSAQIFYKKIFNLYPTIDLLFNQPSGVRIMGGPTNMSFDMCLMGNGQYKSGMEQHVYGDTHPEYHFQHYPSDFTKTGLASACWKGQNVSGLSDKIIANGGEVISDVIQRWSTWVIK